MGWRSNLYENENVGSIINRYCKAYNINQKLILVTLQREMGLVSKTDISQVKDYTRPNGEVLNPLNVACGCGVPDYSPSNSKHYGFGNQIIGACATYRKHFDNWKPGMIKELLDKGIKACIPETALTYSLLCYTPWLTSLTTSEKIYVRYFPEILK